MNRLTIFVILLVSIGTACADAGTALDSNASSNKLASISQVPAPLMAVTDADAVNKQNEATVGPAGKKNYSERRTYTRSRRARKKRSVRSAS